MTNVEPTLIGTLLDRRYLITSLLARGGMSTVYRGTDTRLQRPVAIKIMHPAYAADRNFVDRFTREARAAARLHHPNVVTVHDQGSDATAEAAHAFLVMELIEGCTLRDLIDAKGPLDAELALSVTEPVLAALAAAHKAGLVHRDIKPENVLIGHSAAGEHGQDDAVVKVADFGLVRAIASAGTTSSSVILGTVAYLSPEQVTTGVATERSDVYSTGLLLYEMLTGTSAFTGDTALSVAYQHVNADVPAVRASNPDVPIALADLVAKATHRDPATRPADAAAFLRELRQVRAELGLRAVPVPALPAPGGAATAENATVPQVDGPRGTRMMARPADPDDQPTQTQPAVVDHAPKRTRRKVALLVLALLVLAGLVGGGLWLTEQARVVAVPKVAGLTEERAKEVLGTADLTAEVVRERHNDVAEGTAIGTEPGAGTELRMGASVTLIISLGKPTVPDIAEGATLDEAREAITDVQLEARHDPQADDYHSAVPEGRVIGVSPEPGTELEIGATVTVALSLGPPPNPVPDVAGLDRDDAFDTLRDAGFEPFDAGEEFDAGIAAGKVVRTDPGTGSTPDGDRPRVGVYVSNAVDVPDVTNRRLRQAERVLADAGLTAKVIEGGNRRIGFEWVVNQSPGKGDRLPPGGTVELTVFP